MDVGNQSDIERQVLQTVEEIKSLQPAEKPQHKEETLAPSASKEEVYQTLDERWEEMCKAESLAQRQSEL